VDCGFLPDGARLGSDTGVKVKAKGGRGPENSRVGRTGPGYHRRMSAAVEGSGRARPRAVVLVEGVSDRAALEVLARRRGMDLDAEGVALVSMSGITNLGHFLDRGTVAAGVGSVAGSGAETGPRIAGLYDDGEERFVRRVLERAGVTPGPGRPGLEACGFFACLADLEDELIRALGPTAVVELVEAAGHLRSFRILQRQPAQRGRGLHDQLRRLMGGRSGGKERYAALMARAVALDRAPRPLAAVLDYARANSPPAADM
jgi:hypothetical protein